MCNYLHPSNLNHCTSNTVFPCFVFNYRLLLVSIIFFDKYRCLTVRQNGQLKVYSYHNAILYGFTYRNITTHSMEECLQHCLSDCLCQLFQICGNTCQLGSTAKGLKPAAARQHSKRCTIFEFENRKNLYVSLKLLLCLAMITQN